jgi:hypothetical protein
MLESLGPYEFNLIRGEGDRFELSAWTDGSGLLRALGEIARDNRSGDIYARLSAEGGG